MNILILGTGSFGEFLTKLMPKSAKITLLSSRKSSDEELASAVKSAEVIVLAIPFKGYASTIERLKPFLQPQTLIVDVCSVKVKPIQLLHKLLPNHQNWLMTHPLFGPESGKHSVAGLNFVVCESRGEVASEITRHFEDNLQTNIVKMSAEEHDKQMATAQGLTFFLSEVLHGMGVHNQRLMTPSYQKLLDLSRLYSYESQELLDILQLDNPYTAELRQQFIGNARRVDQDYIA